MVFETNYTYDDDNRLASIVDGHVSEVYSYDAYGRLSNLTAKLKESTILANNYTYRSPGSGKTSGQVASHSMAASGYNKTLNYTYDKNGNILSISDGSKTTSYVYDSANQLTRENNQAAGKTWTWTYDDAGNITSRKEYAYTTGTLGTATDTASYTYGDTDWGDLLTGYDGKTITHDGIGNPLSDGTWTYTWQHGRELASMTNGSTTWTYAYNADGQRIRRTNGSTKYTYYYTGGNLRYMTVGAAKLFFIMDASGQPTELYYRSGAVDTYYYYVRNIQGDIIALLDTSGNKVVEYTYDAWGNVLSITGSLASTVGVQNPFRYRGYVYDDETGLYYLQSRYYDPEMGRFINADELVTTGQGHVGNNMFAYCCNNPVNMADNCGTLPFFIISGVALATVGGIIGYAATGSLKGAVAGIAIGGAVGLTGGAIAAKILAGSALANTGAVVAGGISALGIVPTTVYSSWRAAEQALRKSMNSVQYSADRTFSTPWGNRIADAYNKGLHKIGEAKYGYQGLSTFIQRQIAKDVWLLQNDPRVNSIEWHFYHSVKSGTHGLSNSLRSALKAAGIKIVEHFK